MMAALRREEAAPPRPTVPVAEPAQATRRIRPADALLPAAVVLWIASVTRVDANAMTDWGLLPALPVTFFLSLGLLAVSIAAVVAERGASSVRLALHLGALILVLHGTVPLVTVVPNYPWSYKHIGVVNYINLRGGLNTSIDVYHNWPGFFAVAAWFTKIAGVGSPLAYAAWAPLYFNALSCLELAFVFRALPAGRNVRWLGLFLFVGGNWVGQDYFAPQAMGFVLSLAVLGAALTWLQVNKPSLLGRGLRRLAHRLVTARARVRDISDAMPASAWTGARPDRIGLLFAVFAIVVVTHQLSPFMAVFALGMLTAVGFVRPRWAVGALGVMAAAFVLAHLFSLPRTGIFYVGAQDLITFLGHPFGRNPTGSQPQPGRRWTALGAPALILVIWGLGSIGALRRLRAGRPTIVLVTLAVSPTLLLLIGGYGGEAMFRIYLFSLPWAALLAACALDRRGLPRRGPSAAVLLVVVSLFMSAFYGSEELYRMRPGEVDASTHFHRHAPPGSTLFLASPDFPEKIGGNYDAFPRSSPTLLMTVKALRHRELGPRDVRIVEKFVRDHAPGGRGVYLALSASQAVYAEVLGLTPPGALAALGRALERSPRWPVVYRNDDATIYRFSPPGAVAPPATPRLPTSANRRWVDWTQLAIAVIGLGLVAVRGRRAMRWKRSNGHEPTITDGGVLLEFVPAPPERHEPSESETVVADEVHEPVAAVVRRALSHDDAARDDLARRGPVWRRLDELLHDLEPQMHDDAIRLLVDAWGPASLADVTAALADPRPPVRSAALGAVGVRTEDAPQLLWILANDYSEQVRVAALRALRATREGDQIAALRTALSDPAAGVRVAALDSLAAAGLPSAAEVLLAAAVDGHADVRAAAARRLASSDEWVLWMALRNADDPAVLCEAIEAAAPGRLPAMAVSRLASPDPDDRRTAVRLVRILDAADARAVLTRAAFDPDSGVRRTAVGGLSESADALPVLVEALRDPDGTVRCAAVDSLATVEHDDATTALVGALTDPDVRVRNHAAGTLALRPSPGLARRLGEKLSAANAASIGPALLGMGRVGEDVLLAAVVDGPADRAAAAADLLRDRSDIVGRLDDLDAVDADRRLRAVEVVAKISRAGAVDRLIGALSDPWPPIRAAAVRHLEAIGDERGVAAVRELLRTEQDADVIEASGLVTAGAPA